MKTIWIRGLTAALVTTLVAACSPAPSTSNGDQGDPTPSTQASSAGSPDTTSQPSAAAACEPNASFPEDGKPITIIVPWNPGGNSDIGTRLVAAALEKQLHTSIVVENKPGATSQIGLTELAGAKVDGYTLAHVDAPSFFTTYLIPDRQAIYDRNDFAPVARYAGDAVVFAVPADSPFETIQDVIDAAKANPATVKMGTNGQLGIAHITAIKVERATDTKFALVHLDGSAKQVQALLGSHIDVAVAGKVNFLPHLKNGTVRVLAILTKERNALMPDVPTLAEQGIEAYSSSTHGIVAPAGTPEEVICVLSAALGRAMDEGLREELAKTGLDVNFMDAEAYGKLLEQDETELIPLLKEIGVL